MPGVCWNPLRNWSVVKGRCASCSNANNFFVQSVGGLCALAADDGSPLPVTFTIARLDGSIIDSVSNVPVAEFTLPTEEFVASFDYQGRQGYKSLVVKGGQTHTHTFNIRTGQPQPVVQGDMMQLPEPPPVQMPQQPQNMEDMLMQRLQQELNKMTN